MGREGGEGGGVEGNGEGEITEMKVKSPTKFSSANTISAILIYLLYYTILSIIYYIILYYWHYVTSTTSPILPELVYDLGSTDRKRKKRKNKMETGDNLKRQNNIQRHDTRPIPVE
jgi:hypothetical protein